MTISSLTKKAALSLALATAAMSSAHASQHDIQLWANVDPTLDLRKADGTPLWDTVRLTYSPGVGLDRWSQNVRIHTNDPDNDVEVRLGFNPTLTLRGDASTSVPLTVKLNDENLSTDPTRFTADMLFPGGLDSGTSISMPLSISQTTTGELASAGNYQGAVSIVMVQRDPIVP
ncbi:TPA: CS1 type fimbrial major subunit [Stenotrophomonas maltophilia]